MMVWIVRDITISVSSLTTRRLDISIPNSEYVRVLEVRVQVCVLAVVVDLMECLAPIPHLSFRRSLTCQLISWMKTGTQVQDVGDDTMRWQAWSRTKGGRLTVQPRDPYCDTRCECNRAQRAMRRKSNIIRLRQGGNAYKFGDATTVRDLEMIWCDRGQVDEKHFSLHDAHVRQVAQCPALFPQRTA